MCILRFADVKARARMMAAVFLMQPLGQLTAAWVGWVVLVGLVRKRGLYSLEDNSIPQNDNERILILSTIDSIWRCVIGVGAFPALVAIIYRISIPESPRYTMDVERDGKRAVLDIRRHRDISNDQIANSATARQDAIDEIIRIGPDGNPARREIEKPNYFTLPEVKNFLFTEGNWRYLAATSLCWFFLDFAFYGLGINNPRQLAAIWASTPFNFTALHDWRNMTTPSFCQLPNSQQIALTPNHTYDWQNPFDPDSDMYLELFSNAKQYIITISCGSMGGSIVLLLLGDRVSRRKWLMYSFLILAASFACTAIVLQHVELTDRHSATIVFYVFCQFFFNFGAF